MGSSGKPKPGRAPSSSGGEGGATGTRPLKPAGGEAPGSAGEDGAGAGGGAGEPLLDVVGQVNESGFAWMDSYFLVPCFARDGTFCALISGTNLSQGHVDKCPNQHAPNLEDRGYIFSEAFDIGGDVGAVYDVTLRINGLVEGKYYRDGVRAAGDEYHFYSGESAIDNSFYVGGEPIPSNYAVYKLTVFEADGTTEVQHYYLNSFPQQSNAESQMTYRIGYEATIAVPGGGRVRHTYQKPNCVAIDNISPGGGNNGPPRFVPNEPDLVIPALFGGAPTAAMNVMNGAQQPWHSQIAHITVTDVVAR